VSNWIKIDIAEKEFGISNAPVFLQASDCTVYGHAEGLSG